MSTMQRLLAYLFVVCLFWGAFDRDVVQPEVHLVVGTSAQGGQYSTVQAAVEAVPVSNIERHIIDIMPGTYMERVNIPSNKPLANTSLRRTSSRASPG